MNSYMYNKIKYIDTIQPMQLISKAVYKIKKPGF